MKYLFFFFEVSPNLIHISAKLISKLFLRFQFFFLGFAFLCFLFFFYVPSTRPPTLFLKWSQSDTHRQPYSALSSDASLLRHRRVRTDSRTWFHANVSEHFSRRPFPSSVYSSIKKAPHLFLLCTWLPKSFYSIIKTTYPQPWPTHACQFCIDSSTFLFSSFFI